MESHVPTMSVLYVCRIEMFIEFSVSQVFSCEQKSVLCVNEELSLIPMLKFYAFLSESVVHADKVFC